MSNVKDCCCWNPKNKPTEKIGTCQGEEHYDITDTPKRNQKVRLWMLYSERFNDWLGSEKHSDEEHDESENWQYLPNSEKYYCESCHEAMTE